MIEKKKKYIHISCEQLHIKLLNSYIRPVQNSNFFLIGETHILFNENEKLEKYNDSTELSEREKFCNIFMISRKALVQNTDFALFYTCIQLKMARGQLIQPILTEKPVIWSKANSADPDKMPHNVASDQGLLCLLTRFSIKNRIKATK